MKTSAMKMPLSRTTSSVLFASASPTIRPPADEDGSKADEQVSNDDDTSTSTSSAMKMPLPRTTSTIPVALAYQTSHAPADEDGRKAAEQVSADDDPSTSASSSTSEKVSSHLTRGVTFEYCSI